MEVGESGQDESLTSISTHNETPNIVSATPNTIVEGISVNLPNEPFHPEKNLISIRGMGGGNKYGGEVGEVLHSFYSAFGFYKFIFPRPPHFLSASYAPDHAPPPTLKS